MGQKDNRETSWEAVSAWYDSITSTEGHYYHQHVVLPGVMKLFNFDRHSLPPSVLDLGCGQGILGRVLAPHVRYHGVDLSSSLITQAKKYDKNKSHSYSVGDITKSLVIKEKYSHAAMILCLQNVEHPQLALNQAAKHLLPGGTLVMVLNHPCFRIPRQSAWGVDEAKKIQYRRLDRYLTPQKIPIAAHPSKKEASESTLSFHFPLQSYCQFLANANFMVHWVEEWVSPKKSTGAKAKMENRAREEFPLFLAIEAKLKSPNV